MDPDAILQELRELYNEFVQDEGVQFYDPGDLVEILVESLSLFDNLDNWIVSGGFLPAEWSR